jgi:hypothetical protein
MNRKRARKKAGPGGTEIEMRNERRSGGFPVPRTSFPSFTALKMPFALIDGVVMNPTAIDSNTTDMTSTAETEK